MTLSCCSTVGDTRHKSVTAARTASSVSGLPSHFQAAVLQDLGQAMVVQRLPMPTDIQKDQVHPHSRHMGQSKLPSTVSAMLNISLGLTRD